MKIKNSLKSLKGFFEILKFSQGLILVICGYPLMGIKKIAEANPKFFAKRNFI